MSTQHEDMHMLVLTCGTKIIVMKEKERYKIKVVQVNNVKVY